MEIIPAIDIIGGKCVRLTEGDYAQKKVYREDPLEVAKEFEDIGIRRLHLVDLDGAKAKEIVNAEVLEDIATNTSLAIDFGGGIKNDEAIRLAFSCGAKQVTLGSIAVKEPRQVRNWLSEFGTEKLILGADVKNRKIAVNGWKETTEVELDDFLEDYRKDGLKYVICTDISKDGKLEGPSFELYQHIMDNYPWYQLIASGGIRDVEDLKRLKEMGLSGAIVGKAIYEGRITLKELADWNKTEG